MWIKFRVELKFPVVNKKHSLMLKTLIVSRANSLNLVFTATSMEKNFKQYNNIKQIVFSNTHFYQLFKKSALTPDKRYCIMSSINNIDF